MEKDDVELIQNILSGDENAFSVLVKRYQKGVHALAWRKVRDYHIAEEITQDAFLQAHRKLASLKDPRLFPGWLYVIADRLCRSWFRKRKLNMQSLESTSETALEKTDYANYICEQRESAAIAYQREIVQRLMAKLPESERTVMVLYYLGEMDCKEISRFLGVSPNTVKSRLRRARERLKSEEHILRETLGSVPLHPNLTENIMRNIDPVQQSSPSGGKSLLPLGALGASVILVVLLMGASREIANNFQQPYSLEAESEPTIEIVEAPIVLKSQSKRDLQNRVGNGTIRDTNNSNRLSTGTESMPIDIVQDVTRWHLPEKAKVRFGKGRIRNLTYFPDGTRLAVWSSIGIWIYDVRTGTEIELFARDAGEASGTALSPDGQTFAFTDYTNIHLWDLQMKREKNVFTGHTSHVSALAFSPTSEILASGGVDTTVRLWDVRTGELVRTLVGHTDRVMYLAYSPGGKTLASVVGFEDSTVCLWDVQTGQLLQTITERLGKACRVAYSPDGLTLVSGSRDSKIRFWDVGTGKLIKTIQTDMASVTSVVYSPDGRTLASGSGASKNIYLWDVHTGELLKTLIGPDQVGSLVYAPDGKMLTSKNEDGTVRFWDPHTGELLKTISGWTFFARSVAFSPDGGTLVSSEGADKTIVLRDVQTGKTLETLVDHTDSARSVKYLPDGKIIASPRWVLRSTGSHSVKYSPDGKIIASGSWDGPIRLWDVQTGALLRTLIGHKEGAPSIAYSPDGTVLISGSWDNTIRFWDLHTGELMRTLTGNTTDVEARQGVRSISLSRDGRTLAAATNEQVIRLWDAHTGEVKATLTGHTGAGAAVAFSPNRSLLASGSEDGTIRLWNTTTGELLLTFPEQPNSIMSIAFSPDGQKIASGSWREVYISDLVTGKSIATLTGHGEWVRSVAFSPDGEILASGSDDGTVLLWDLTHIHPQSD